MDKFKLIEKVENSNIDESTRTELVNLLKRYAPYGLHYEPKAETAADQLATHLPVLHELAERQVEAPLLGGVGGGLIDHLLIEGENLHVLTALQYTHYQKVDVIYIDPPYNTGNKDFTYNDNYVDKEDAYRHTKWLSFMERRLRLAKNLLKDTGVIFISIDDNEQAQLKLLCDKIFGEGNFVGEMIRKTKSSTNDSKTGFNMQHEYVLIYGKEKKNLVLFGGEKDLTRYQNPDNDPNGDWATMDPTAKSGTSTLLYDIINPYTGTVDKPPKGRYWQFSKSGLEEHIKNGKIVFKKEIKNNERGFIFKNYKNELRTTEKTLDSLVLVDNLYMNQSATKEVLDIMQNEIFFYPKSIGMIYKILQHGSQKDSLILDFFAGSGTTLHATMELNAQDGGKRQCILVTNNENYIAEQVCYERVKRVIQGYTNSKGNFVDGLPGNRLRYFKSEPFELKPGTKSREMLTKQLAGLLCMREACYNAIPVHIARNDKTVPPNILSQFANDDDSKRLFILYDESEIDDCLFYLDELVCSAIDGLRTMPKIFVYVYSPSDYPYTEDFDVLNEYIELKAIPDLILRALR